MAIKVDALNEAIKNALDDYNANVVEGLKKNTTRAMKDLVNATKTTAPVGKRTAHYRDNITSQTVSESRYGITKRWYVKGADYRLSHLLNNGHALRDGGRYPGTKFIEKAVDVVLPWYINAVEDTIKNG